MVFGWLQTGLQLYDWDLYSLDHHDFHTSKMTELCYKVSSHLSACGHTEPYVNFKRTFLGRSCFSLCLQGHVTTHKQGNAPQGENNINLTVQWSMHDFSVDSLCQVLADPQSIFLLDKFWLHFSSSFDKNYEQIKHFVWSSSATIKHRKKEQKTSQDEVISCWG